MNIENEKKEQNANVVKLSKRRKINHSKHCVKIEDVEENKITSEQKSMIINDFLNSNFFDAIWRDKHKRGILIDMNKEYDYIYKYTIKFKNQSEKPAGIFWLDHTMLAIVVFNPKTSNEHPSIQILRDNLKKVYEFSKDDNAQVCKLKAYDKQNQTSFLGMLKHILASDKNLPSNIDISSLTHDNADRTFKISKR